jgi:hypothetical protein
MGIDRIGKPPIPPSPSGSVTGATPSAGETFQVGKASAADSAAPTSLLDRLKSGELNLDQYLELRVTDAVQHLDGKISAEQLDFVKQSLREQLRTDPVLVELVRRSTGMTPEASEA